MKYILLIFLCIYASIAQGFFYRCLHNGKIKALICVYPQDQQNSQLYWDYFFEASLEVPLLLKYARDLNVPVIIISPEELHGFSPLDDKAPLIEGARVAIAWASAYFRAFQLDVRILLYSGDSSLSNDLILKLSLIGLQYPIEDSKKIEDALKNRILSLKSIDGTLEPGYVLEKHIIMSSHKSYHQIKSSLTGTHKKNVLITGAAGFIGSHLTHALLERGWHVIGLDTFACSSAYNIKSFKDHPNFEFFSIDVTEPYEINCPIDIIIHLASIPSPFNYYRLPVETLATGLQATKNALDVALSKGACFIFNSSSEVYGDTAQTPQQESYPGYVIPWGMRSQYDESKRGGETICKWYFEKHGLDIIIPRIFNTYGPRMSIKDGRVITNFIGAILNKEPIIIHGSGNQTRSFAYISDTISALLKLIDADLSKATTIPERVFNIGNEQEFSINDIAKKINLLAQECIGYQVSIEHIVHPDPTDPKIRRPDLTRIKSLGYEPCISLDDGLEDTFLYFLKYEKR